MTEEAAGLDRGRAVVVVTALREELAPIAGRFGLERVNGGTAVEVWRGRAADRELVAAVTGDGARAAERGLRAVLDRFDPSAVLGLGVAGGLSPDLAPAEVVVARRVVAGREVLPAPDPGWLERALRLPGTRAGTVLSEARLAVDPPAKNRLRLRLGGDGPAVVDLESASWARLAAGRGIPYLVARAVSDTASEALPLDFNLFRDRQGGIDRRRIGRHLLLRPGLLAPLLGLRKRVEECAAALATFLQGMIAE